MANTKHIHHTKLFFFFFVTTKAALPF